MLIMLASMQMIVYNPLKVTPALTLILVLYVAATGPHLEARNIGNFHNLSHEPPKLSALRPLFMGGQRSSKYSEEHPIITDEVHPHGPKCPMSSDFHRSDHGLIRATHGNRNDHHTGGSWNFSFGSKMDQFWPMPPQPPPPEVVGKHIMEEHHEDSISHEPLMDDKWPHDSVYELINNRFWGEKDAGQNPRTHEEEKRERDLKENWRTWMNVISYFPSGREQLERNKNNQNTPPSVDPSTDSMRAQEIKSSDQLLSGEVVSAERPPDGAQVGGRSIQQVNGQLNVGAEQATTKGLVAQDNERAPTRGLKSGDEINELDQQDPLRRIELPITMHTHDQIFMGPEENARVASRQSENRQATSEAGLPRVGPTTIATTQATAPQRVRDSLLRAADIARNLNLRQLANNSNSANHNQAIRETVSRTWSVAPAEETSVSNSPENSSAAEAAGVPPTATTTTTSRLNTGMSRRQLEAGFISRQPSWSTADGRLDNTFEVNSANNSSRLTPKFLGFGLIQKDDGNGRTQARLSCQFGDLTQSENVTISDVEWARFLGSYETERRPEPGFDCGAEESSCRIVPVKTDTITTIHPRPLIQSYLSTQAAPATYSVTLHEVDDSQYGIYRCSAIRQTTGNARSMELVYRILNFQ